MSEQSIERRLHELREIAKNYSKAQAERVYLEDFKKSKLAILMKEAETHGVTTSAGQERDARAHQDYLTLLLGLKSATETAERLYWELKIAAMGAELWRTQQATMRSERKGYGT